jgi:hypothetical protein
MITGVVLILLGTLAILLRKAMMKQSIAWNKLFGLKFNAREYKYGEIVAIFGGSILIITGILEAK